MLGCVLEDGLAGRTRVRGRHIGSVNFTKYVMIANPQFRKRNKQFFMVLRYPDPSS